MQNSFSSFIPQGWKNGVALWVDLHPRHLTPLAHQVTRVNFFLFDFDEIFPLVIFVNFSYRFHILSSLRPKLSMKYKFPLDLNFHLYKTLRLYYYLYIYIYIYIYIYKKKSLSLSGGI
jgi:hypothetical protein